MTSQQAPSNVQQFGRASASGAAPDLSNSTGSPVIGSDLPLLARNGIGHPLGKMTAELGRVRMNEETLLALQAKAVEHGMTLSEYVRVVLECAVFGADVMASIAADRIRRVGLSVALNAPHESTS
jgi:hypothetical protein